MSKEKQRKRLIEILSQPIFPKIGVDPAEVVADYLLDNGVIVPPCKVGDVLYRIEEKHIEDDTYLVYEFMVDRQYVLNDKISIFVHRIWNGKTLTSYEVFENSDIGKTVFLTREEAEKALEERENNV